MTAAEEVIAAVDRRAVVRGDGMHGHVIAYLDQPSVTIELASGERRHVALSVFRDRWSVDAPPTEYAIRVVEQSLRRNVNPAIIADNGTATGPVILEFARQVALEAVAEAERDMF